MTLNKRKNTLNIFIYFTGTIGFHNNPLLCLTEIEELAKEVSIKYNDIDVSRNSNGDKASCSLINLNIKITSITSKNLSLSWQAPKCDQICIGYTVFYKISYTKELSKFSSKDGCRDNLWNSVFTSNTSLVLKGLLPYKKYAFYIKYYQSSGQSGSETNLTYFNTLPDSPPPPPNLIAVGIAPDTIQLQWNKSSKNGVLSHYRAKYYALDEDIQESRDYCINPRT